MQNLRYNSTDNPDIYFDYMHNRGQNTVQDIKFPSPIIFFMYSGKLTIRCKSESMSVKKGECIFLQANTTATFQIACRAEESFCGIYISFNKSFLLEFHNNYYSKNAIPAKGWEPGDIMKMPCTPYMESLYISLIPYLERNIKPEKNILKLKRIECIYCILASDPRFYTALFDFIKPIEQNLFYIISKNNLN